MNKFLLKILILCIVTTGSFLAVQTNAQNTAPKLDITTTEKDTIGTVSIKTTGFQTIEKEKDGFYSLNIYKKNSLNNFIPIKRETKKIASIWENTTTEITGLPKGDYRAIGVFINMDTPNNQPITTQKDFSVKNSTKGPLCMVLNATFNPSGTQPAGWFKDSQRPKVSVDIQTSDCAKNFLIFSITESDYFGDDQTSEIEEKKILVTDTEKMTLQFEAGETDCDNESIGGSDCEYYIEIDMENSSGNVISSFSSQGRTNGELLYDCDGPCVSDWKPLNMPESGQAVTASADMTPNADTDTTYTPLAPISETLGGCTLPDGTIKENCIDTAEAGAFGKYFNALIRIFIGFCAVLAMIMIVAGGMQYMTSELVSGKEEAKKRIWGAVGGLILALASYAILNTINPQLLDISLSGVAKAEIEISGESSAPFQSISTEILDNKNIYCPGRGGTAELSKIAQSFIGKATYSQVKRNTYDSSKNTAYFDCSSFVAQVYQCAGLPIPGNTTANIFSSATSLGNTKIKQSDLKVGDLLGWKQGEDSKSTHGHVVMYLGGGQVIDAHGPSEKLNKAVTKIPLNFYLDRIKHIKRAP